MRFGTQQDVEKYLVEYQQKMGIKPPVVGHEMPEYKASEWPESVLQGKIVKYCKEHGYPCL